MELIKVKESQLPFHQNENANYDLFERYEFIDTHIYEMGGFHPGRVIGFLTQMMNNHDEESQEIYIDLLISNSTYLSGAMVFPYRFDFALHANQDDILSSGWISGFCQGLALCYFSKRDHGRSDITDYIRDSLLLHEILEETAGMMFFNEYEGRCKALNGHIYALYGLYTHWYYTDDPISKRMLIQGIQWVINHFAEFRNVKNPSYYCTTHHILCDKVGGKYHAVHINQLLFLYRITGDPVLKEFAKQLWNDFKPDRTFELKHLLYEP